MHPQSHTNPRTYHCLMCEWLHHWDRTYHYSPPQPKPLRGVGLLPPTFLIALNV